jgi:hypothetical protein
MTTVVLSHSAPDGDPQPFTFQRGHDGFLYVDCLAIGLTLRLTDPEAADLCATLTAALEATHPYEEDDL